MGFFSWKTMDTGKSISNRYSGRGTFPVTMTDDKGNRWHETDYDGYGVFGGMDYYDLLAQMNGSSGRDEGISLAFSKLAKEGGVVFPNLTEDCFWSWANKEPESCEAQGYFYHDSEFCD